MKVPVRIEQRRILADIITPVSIYLKIRDIYPNALLLESSDYHSKENSYSFICMKPIAEFKVNLGQVSIDLPGQDLFQAEVSKTNTVVNYLNSFIDSFDIQAGEDDLMVDGVFGYSTYDAVQYYEDIKFKSSLPEKEQIPEVRYNFFKYVLAINHLVIDFHHQVVGAHGVESAQIEFAIRSYQDYRAA